MVSGEYTADFSQEVAENTDETMGPAIVYDDVTSPTDYTPMDTDTNLWRLCWKEWWSRIWYS